MRILKVNFQSAFPQSWVQSRTAQSLIYVRAYAPSTVYICIKFWAHTLTPGPTSESAGRMCVFSRMLTYSLWRWRGMGWVADKMQIAGASQISRLRSAPGRESVNSPFLYVLAHHCRQNTFSHISAVGFAGVGAAECAGAGRLSRRPAAGRRHRRGRLPRHAQKKTQSQAQEKCRGE